MDLVVFMNIKCRCVHEDKQIVLSENNNFCYSWFCDSNRALVIISNQFMPPCFIYFKQFDYYQ